MVKVVGVLLVVLLGSLTGAEGCDRPNTNRQTDPKTRRTVIITAKSNIAPYEVIVDVYDETGAHEGNHEYIASEFGEYRQTLYYTPGRRLKIRVEVKPPRRRSFTYCRIRDGRNSNYDDTGRSGEKGWRAICELTTSR